MEITMPGISARYVTGRVWRSISGTMAGLLAFTDQLPSHKWGSKEGALLRRLWLTLVPRDAAIQNQYGSMRYGNA